MYDEIDGHESVLEVVKKTGINIVIMKLLKMN